MSANKDDGIFFPSNSNRAKKERCPECGAMAQLSGKNRLCYACEIKGMIRARRIARKIKLKKSENF